MGKWKTMFSRFEERETPCTCAGCQTKKEYIAVRNEEGQRVLKVTGEINQQEYIDSFLEGCDISIILNKMANGEISTEFTEKDCADMLNMPKDMVEAVQAGKYYQNLVKELEEKIKEMQSQKEPVEPTKEPAEPPKEPAEPPKGE